ncbi:19862_t:CDS:2 [Entrophospora sp. SA101]|nr:1585_t:CDS:2 [Entrophospora sp. SA101]CAJ0759348.1 13072_t:CDS:2 [Entrophospora sp. SA101]CAJ0760701.1 19862_t:CDS:2 [Entrophospora sp. SA101]CAJ0836502.1 15314_t:CDS:2 [Entrophospora sp. SA101]CAJ0853513.1 1614_t:CDS:2 [Entrophospora sp. SA101]
MLFAFGTGWRKSPESKKLQCLRWGTSIIVILLYLAFLTYLIVNDKPSIQISYEYLDRLSIPDIELCGDYSDIEISKCVFHWNNNENSTDGCSSESRIFESEKVTLLNKNGEEIRYCYTLRTNSSYFFSDPGNPSEGLSTRGIDFYFKILNISSVVEHFLSVGTITGRILDKEYKNLLSTNPVKKRFDQQMNTFAGIQNVSTMVFFKKTTLSTLPDDVSTILGLPSNYHSTPFFTTVSKYFQMHPNESFPFTGHFHITPGSFLHEVQSEKRSYTVLGTLVVAGGIFGLIGGIYMLFFGQPRMNPWGLMRSVEYSEIAHEADFNNLPFVSTTKHNKEQIPTVESRILKLEEIVGEYVTKTSALQEQMRLQTDTNADI